MTPFWTLGAMRPVVEAALWVLIVLCCLLPFASLLATALVPAFGVKLTLSTMTFDKFAEVLLRQSVTVRAFAQLVPVRRQRRADPVVPRHRARLCAGAQGRKIPPRPRGGPRDSLRVAGRRAGDRLHPAVPAAAAADRHQHLRDAVHHRVRVSGALPAARAETAARRDGGAGARSGGSLRARRRECLAAPAPRHRAESAAGRGGGRRCWCFCSPSTS